MHLFGWAADTSMDHYGLKHVWSRELLPCMCPFWFKLRTSQLGQKYCGLGFQLVRPMWRTVFLVPSSCCPNSSCFSLLLVLVPWFPKEVPRKFHMGWTHLRCLLLERSTLLPSYPGSFGKRFTRSLFMLVNFDWCPKLTLFLFWRDLLLMVFNLIYAQLILFILQAFH